MSPGHRLPTDISLTYHLSTYMIQGRRLPTDVSRGHLSTVVSKGHRQRK